MSDLTIKNELVFDKSDSEHKKLVSIIIRCKNEEKHIKICLDKIFSQKVNFKYEVIIIDSCSTDNTIEIAKNYNLKIYKIYPKDFNFGTSINLGLYLSKSKYCVFLSAHAIPKNKFWLINLIKNFKDNNVAAVYSKQTYYKNSFYIEKRNLEMKFNDIKRIQNFKEFSKKYGRKPNSFREYKDLIVFSNASSCIRREIGIENRFSKICASEDREWALRTLTKGYTIIYEPKSVVYHAHNENLYEWYKRIYINAKAVNIFSGFKFRVIYALPIIFLNIFRDINFLYRKKYKINIKNIITSFKYWSVYVLAYYKATKNKS